MNRAWRVGITEMVLVKHLSKDGHPFIVREANQEDGKAIQSLVNSVALEEKYIVPDDSREDWDKTIEDIKRRKSLIIVAQVGEETAGMAHLVRGRFQKNAHAGSLGILVLKEFRRKGIGTAMMDYVMDWTNKQQGLEKISLTVFSTNQAAIRLYEKFGFAIEGICKKHYKVGEEYIDDVIMAKFLH